MKTSYNHFVEPTYRQHLFTVNAHFGKREQSMPNSILYFDYHMELLSTNTSISLSKLENAAIN